MSGIYWLASYPKSGNTWLRALLTNYLAAGDKPADLNSLIGVGAGFMRADFDEWLGIDSSYLSPAQIAHFRPLVYERMAAEATEPLFLKLHDAYGCNAQGLPIFPRIATAGAIYILRNPLDVVASFAHHLGRTIDETMLLMADEGTLLPGTEASAAQLPQILSSWSSHVASWTEQMELNVHVVRYEDLSQDPRTAFAKIVRYLELPLESHRLERAIQWGSFECLREQERNCGFKERPPTAPSFFRRGNVGTWSEYLTQNQVRRLNRDHQVVMRQFGYSSRTVQA